MLVAARDLVRRKRGLSRAEIREEMSGNLCRCTGYMGIITAIERVMAAMPAASAAFQGGKSWLGPAPGPCAPSPAIGSSSGPASTGRSRSPTRIARGLRHRSRPSIRVDVGQLQEVDGATRISERFVLDHPREAVWALISDPRAMARCMPGLALDDLRGEGQLTGRLEVRIGPISAQFAGTGTLAKFAPEYRLRIVGQGGDRRSGSLATGGVECRLEAIPAGEKGNATEVTAIISYVLTGPLVQFGRSGIVRDFVQRIGETFAQNLDQELRDPGSLGPSAPLGGLSILFRIVGARLRDLLYKISRGRPSE
jgi:carbon-monoxide dehydrogenase small subunit